MGRDKLRFIEQSWILHDSFRSNTSARVWLRRRRSTFTFEQSSERGIERPRLLSLFPKSITTCAHGLSKHRVLRNASKHTREVNFGIFPRRMQLTLPVSSLFSILMNGGPPRRKSYLPPYYSNSVKNSNPVKFLNPARSAVPRIPPKYHRDRYRAFRSHEIPAITCTRPAILAHTAFMRDRVFVTCLHIVRETRVPKLLYCGHIENIFCRFVELFANLLRLNNVDRCLRKFIFLALVIMNKL